MDTINIVSEANIKAILKTIADDMKTKIGNTELGSAVDDYFKNADANSVDLQEAIVNIINNNIETIDINSVMPNLDNYITKTEANAVSERMSGQIFDEINNVKNNTYTKTEVSKMISNISGGIAPVTNVLYDPSGFDKYSSVDMMHNMLIGWNLGNQFECWNKVGNQIDDMNVVNRDLYYETLWGNPKVTKELIDYVASVGIQAIRVPITWRDHIEPNGNAISLTWLARIKEVVDMIIENGMYCIINVHHDGSHKCKQIEFDSDYYLHSMSYFHNLWAQIGDYFKDYGYKLLFEGYNEVTNHTGNMTPSATKEAETVKYAQDFINTVRSQGSNNANRFLVIPNYGGVSIMTADSFSLIHDTATDKLLLTTHAYPSGNTAGDNFYWIPQKLAKNPVGIIIDEIGTMPSDKFDLAFVKDLRTQASKKQISTFWWDNGLREFNLIDRYWHVPSNAALGEYLGKDITIPTFSYDTLKSLTDMPYYAKFDLVDANHDYNKSRYMVICSQKPITDIVAVNNSRGYYGIKADGGLYSVFVSDDAHNYKVIETQLCSDTADLIIGTKHLLWGSTANSLFVESNYQIKNNPMGIQTESEPQPTEPDEPSNPEPTNPVCTNVIVNDSMTIKTPTSIDYTLVPSNCTDNVIFKSNNTAVATVNENGLVTPISDGTAIVTLTCGEIVRTVDVTVNLTSSEEPVTISYKLPEDLNTIEYQNAGLLFASKFPYHVMIHDKINNMYYLHCTDSPIVKTGYSSGTGCIYVGLPQGQRAAWVTMRWNSSNLPKLADYFECNTYGRVKKTSTIPVDMGTYHYKENTEAGLKAVPTIDDIEVIYANYNIEGLYTSDFPCKSVKATDMIITSPEPVKLSYKTTPVFVTDELKFTLSDASVIAIQEDGTIYPQSNGTTNITVKCGSHTATCKVTVTLPERDSTNKTIVRSNYSPNGEAFVDENIAWNKNTDTIFASFTDTNTSENQSVFSVGSNATNAGKWTGNTIHTVYPYKDENGKFIVSVLMNGELRTTIPMSSDNKVKIAINKHNIYVNGTPILENGVWRDNKAGHTLSYNDLMKLTKLAIGSTEGKNRSFANYEEISIHHNLYTATEMKQLTTV